MKKDIAVFVASRFEDVELIASLDVLSREGISYELFAINNEKMVRGEYNAIVETKPITNFKSENFKGILLPGGNGYKLLVADQNVIEIIKSFANNKKIIAAICGGPEALIKADVLKNVKFTSHPTVGKLSNNTGNKVEVDQNFITASDFEQTIDFAKEIVKKIKNL